VARIQKLSDELANQIAAGEVVERPASVVKELVENALDAGSTRITVDVEQGGSRLVRVTDDGEGMSQDDALLALERHATSKIRTLDDLFRLGTFGFRGEALPSIASVSQLTLRTRERDKGEACEIEVIGGRPPIVRPAGSAPGTSIEVRELFFNVPARRKFLKATATESAHVGDVILGSALARPDVTFTLTRDGRTVREYLRVGSRAERARATTTGETLMHVVAERGLLRIEGMLAAPERARSGATGLALLVNGRPVRDRVLARAVAHAYGSVLDGGRYPVGVVWLDLPPDLVDVNVHPQKAEVRFTDARGVFDAITRELHGGLARAFGLPELTNPFAQAAAKRFTAPTLKTLGEAAAEARAMVTAPGEIVAPRPLSEANLFIAAQDRADQAHLFISAETRADAGNSSLGAEGSLFIAEQAESRSADASLWGAQKTYANLQFVGQVRSMFLLCAGEDALFVIDQHAAAERVTFDRLRRSYASKTIAMQRLLVPEVVNLAPAEVALLEENAEAVTAVGVELRAVGDAAVAVHAVPALLARRDAAKLVRDLASELSRAGGRAFGGSVDLVLATMACHGSIRAGDTVAPEEARALLRALDEVDFAGHCPHGRPIIMRLDYRELERRVGR
jgi:DNA mismatch repair protein MutL